MPKLIPILNIPYGQLTPVREFDDGTFHCVCKCGRYRTVSRKRLLDKSVKACAECAKENRRSAGGRQHRPPMPVEAPAKPEPKPECTALCGTRVIHGVKYEAHDPDCKKLNLFKIDERCAQRERWL